MKQLYILILNLFFYLSKFINILYFLYYAFIILKIIDALIKIKYSSYKLWYIGGDSVYYRDPIFIIPPSSNRYGNWGKPELRLCQGHHFFIFAFLARSIKQIRHIKLHLENAILKNEISSTFYQANSPC